MLNSFLDDIHRPSLPYKFKFKFSGCPNDCVNAIQRSDLAAIGTWRDNMRTDETLARRYFAAHGLNELVNDVVNALPDASAIRLVEAAAIPEAPPAHVSARPARRRHASPIDNHDCVRCMHCMNVMPGRCSRGSTSAAFDPDAAASARSRSATSWAP